VGVQIHFLQQLAVPNSRKKGGEKPSALSNNLR